MGSFYFNPEQAVVSNPSPLPRPADAFEHPIHPGQPAFGNGVGAQVVFAVHQRHADHERDGRQPLHGGELLAEEDEGGQVQPVLGVFFYPGGTQRLRNTGTLNPNKSANA